MILLSISKSKFCNFADGNTYRANKNVNYMFSNLKFSLKNILNWFLKIPQGKT